MSTCTYISKRVQIRVDESIMTKYSVNTFDIKLYWRILHHIFQLAYITSCLSIGVYYIISFNWRILYHVFQLAYITSCLSIGLYYIISFNWRILHQVFQLAYITSSLSVSRRVTVYFNNQFPNYYCRCTIYLS